MSTRTKNEEQDSNASFQCDAAWSTCPDPSLSRPWVTDMQKPQLADGGTIVCWENAWVPPHPSPPRFSHHGCGPFWIGQKSSPAAGPPSHPCTVPFGEHLLYVAAPFCHTMTLWYCERSQPFPPLPGLSPCSKFGVPCVLGHRSSPFDTSISAALDLLTAGGFSFISAQKPIYFQISSLFTFRYRTKGLLSNTKGSTPGRSIWLLTTNPPNATTAAKLSRPPSLGSSCLSPRLYCVLSASDYANRTFHGTIITSLSPWLADLPCERLHTETPEICLN